MYESNHYCSQIQEVFRKVLVLVDAIVHNSKNFLTLFKDQVDKNIKIPYKGVSMF